MWFSLAGLLACCVVAPRVATGQDNVGPNEQRFNAGIYKASHNSRERDETLASQIDNWNCWCLELDIVWHLDNQVRVQHGCGSQESAGLLSVQLGLIARSIESADRVTVLYLEMKPACASWPSRGVYREYIKSALEAALPGAIYSSLEFKTIDQFRWPSYQELLRRGYRWVIILDEEETGFADDDFFFGMARGNPATAFEPNSVLINSDDDDDVPKRGDQPDRWMFRAYPTPFCGTPDDEDYYDDAIANGYTFVATNCIDRHYTMTPTTHSASPLHVTSTASGTAFGTLAFPYRQGTGLINAVQRASPRVPIKIDGGLYQVPAGTQLSRPVILRSVGGTVRISAL
jgi:hypothetical protein